MAQKRISQPKVSRSSRAAETDTPTANAKAEAPKNASTDALSANLDAVLDEIDALLDEAAIQMAVVYVARGGQ